MGGSSRSESTNITNTSTVHDTNTQNTSLQGEGNIFGEGNTLINNTSDPDVLMSVADSAFSSLNSIGSGAFSAANSLGGSALNTAGFLGRDAFDLAGTITRDNNSLLGSLGMALIDSSSRANTNSLLLAEEATGNAMDLVSNFTEREQLGSVAGQNKSLMWVAVAAVLVAGVAFVGGRK
ncbi:MAG: hypothetical protein IBX50_13925 [Marinospirillum sp.]|uniref:hypothetical protein n=1 Tax=Marinospirillum sp. TaxID=2183934 RepID=UPI0019E1B6AD|nr:hypothetical protein [Marinospirillum sp.]MBE0507785.1 hypothetical protein [Marinospirillum sp.]